MNIEDGFPSVFIRFFQFEFPLLVLAVVIGVGDLVQIAANDRLRLVLLGECNRRQSFIAGGNIGKAPEIVQEVGALQ